MSVEPVFTCATPPFVGPSAAAVAKYLALINLILALFNLVPAFPMDGGRLLRSALWDSMVKARATQIASRAGTFTSSSSRGSSASSEGTRWAAPGTS
jgi:Zn-dependent protease